MASTWNKIKRAAVEGALLKKAFPGLPENVVVKGLDWLFGVAVRYLCAARLAVDERQVMFISFQGDYTCNPKYIAEEMRRRGVPMKMVCSAREDVLHREGAFPPEALRVEQYSADFYRELMRSGLVVANSVEFLKRLTPRRPGQILVETWHGSLGIKRFDARSNHGRTWVFAARRCGRRADLILSNSRFEDEVYRGTYWKKTPILRCGHPRNDILFSHDTALAEEIRRRVLGGGAQQEGERILLYAPTFRDSEDLSVYNVDFARLRAALERRFGGRWRVLMRLHPSVRSHDPELAAQQGVVDVTDYPDIQELMLAADAALTDYSSWIFDFLLTGRPGFLYASDMRDYVTERGFYYSPAETPFSVAEDNDALERNILAFDGDDYERRRLAFLAEKGCMEDGQASRRAVDRILELMGGRI